MQVVRTRAELSAALKARGHGVRRALVPTMGFLHEGHLSLVDRARAEAEIVQVSVFVNPLQFGPHEDYADYPRDEAHDLALLEARGADLVFVPDAGVMFPDGEPGVRVSPGALGDRLCGAFRPGHFEGVMTVVAKLFGLLRPHVAVFGAKDFQQGVLIRRMVSDLELGVDIVLAPIVRAADGLALSSRNAYLTDAQRDQALGLVRALRAARSAFREGERSAGVLLGVVHAEIARHPGLDLQYAELVDPATLAPVDPVPSGTVLALAAFSGSTRLIDNLILDGSPGEHGA